MAHDVFITYSSKDKETADAICSALEENRIRCWYAPRNIRSGASWAGSIMDGLNNCRIMILVWSANSNVSPHVTREVHHAFNKGVTVIPFRIEDVAPTQELEYYLESVQWLDASTPPLEGNLKRLVEHVQTFIPLDKPSFDSAAQEQVQETERERAAEEARVLAAEEARRRAQLERAKQAEHRHLEEQERKAAEEERRRVSAEALQRMEADVARTEAALAAESQRKQAEQERQRTEKEATSKRSEEQSAVSTSAKYKPLAPTPLVSPFRDHLPWIGGLLVVIMLLVIIALFRNWEF
jgi:chemotaxis protein histidine kinase CheA